jgi:hypothetical protein
MTKLLIILTSFFFTFSFVNANNDNSSNCIQLIKSKKKKKKNRNPAQQEQKSPAPFHCSSVLPETEETKAIVSLLKVYQTYDADGPIQLRRIGKQNDGGYVIPELAMQEADVVIGYGISYDISFEESAAAIYGKPSYGFDCTCPPIQSQQQSCHFVPSCIVGDKSSHSFSNFGTFSEHLDLIGATDKRVFIKMDIEGSEYETIPDILKRAIQITGIVLEVHFMEPHEIAQALYLMQRLNEEFLLVHVHANNGCRLCFSAGNVEGGIPRLLELSYINRRLVAGYEVSQIQRHPTSFDQPNAPNISDSMFTILN